MTKILILFYSRTGVTKKIAEALQSATGADREEIRDPKDRRGALGYLMSGREATLSKTGKILPLQKKLADYDLIIIGTPIWAYNVSKAIRTLVTEQKNNIKKYAFFCTEGGEGAGRAQKKLEELLGQPAIASLELLTKEALTGNYQDKLTAFVNILK